MTTKRWELDPHPDGLSIHLEPHEWSTGEEQPSFHFDAELHTKADAEQLARRLNEHTELLAALIECREALCLNETCDDEISAAKERADAIIARAEAP